MRTLMDNKFLLRKPNWENLDRFIPNRAALDLDYAHYMVTGRRKGIENPWAASPTYQMLLTETFNMNRARIFTFKNKPPTPVEAIPRRLLSPPLHKAKSTKPCRRIPKVTVSHIGKLENLARAYKELGYFAIANWFWGVTSTSFFPKDPERTLDAPDWSSSNIIAIALGNSVYLWNPSDRSIVELVTIDDEDGPITGISWALDGKHIAVGLNNSWVQLWILGGHHGRVGSLAWNKHILTTGGMDGRIINNDVRVRSHIVGTYRGHGPRTSVD
ncbi:zinc finger protein-related protein [Prunus dulcis]|uniref:Zinc finger protein-related protein n=1 Tax=Prunus dulcis TaxID=3755 RepID=A0A4Y1RT61_PRUDU|nr:zinc finger protein-related protein [Prunus dulcis]